MAQHYLGASDASSSSVPSDRFLRIDSINSSARSGGRLWAMVPKAFWTAPREAEATVSSAGLGLTSSASKALSQRMDV